MTYSAQSTSLGSRGGQTAGTITIASSAGGTADGGRFNLVGQFGAALNGTFLSYSGGGPTCNYEATAITDSGASGSSLTARTAARTPRAIAPLARTAARGRKGR
jgi:hypothetical protein